MALTTSEKAQVRWYLGYPDLDHDSDSELDGAMGAIGPEAEDLIRAQLADLTTLKSDMLAARRRAKAEQVGSIRLDAFKELATLARLGRQYVGQVAACLSTKVRHDVFSGSAPSADNRVLF